MDREKDSPWLKNLSAAQGRCKYKNSHSYKNYGGRGIKCLLSIEDIKIIWFRDKAFDMERPSLDRINNDGNYTLENCRFIELRENCKQSRSRLKRRIKQLSLDGSFIREFDSIQDALMSCSIDGKKYLGTGRIHDCLKGRRNKAFGYKWKVEEAYGKDK